MSQWSKDSELSAVASADVQAVVATVQGLLIYDVVAQPFYGVELSPQQVDAIHERYSAGLLALARAVDSRPLTQPRPSENRVAARCHAFSRMTVALLRASGVPARARCGFAGKQSAHHQAALAVRDLSQGACRRELASSLDPVPGHLGSLSRVPDRPDRRAWVGV